MENNINPNTDVLQAEEAVIFCRKCGKQLTNEMTVCEHCGTAILNEQIEPQEEIPFNNEEYEESKRRLRKKKRKKVLTIAIIMLSVAVLAVVGFFISKLIVTPQDINTINGCPEFYNIEFGMSLNQASENIKLKHKTIKGIKGNSMFEVNEFMKNDSILIDDGEVFYLYGKETEYVHIGFDVDRVDSVIFDFSPEKHSLDDIVSLYKRIYGEPTTSGSIYATWSGPKTTIDVFDFVSEDGENSIVVRYVITPNSQYTTLTFDGKELDPCDFLGKNNPFDKRPDYFIKGLKEGDDYNKEEFSAEGFGGFKKYTLYPRFIYMGIDKGYTAISFDMGYDANAIETASYLFLLSDSNAVDRLEYIHSALTEKYGTAKSSTYTSTYYDKMGVQDVGFDEMIKRIEKGTEGLYHVQWQSDGRNITLGLTISVDKEYYEGSVAYTD